jgi:two-component system response regulator VanR
MKDDKHVILYVDDDPDMLQSIRMILEANEGIKKFKETNPDLIIVDLMMEEVDSGTNFAKELQFLKNTAPVYMLSSVGDQLNMATSYTDLGLAGVFQKPISPDHLIKTIKSKLG